VKRPLHLAWLGLAPFAIFAVAFEILPMLILARSSLIADGRLSLSNFVRALSPQMTAAFGNSLFLSFCTAFAGITLGTAVAYAIITSRRASVRHGLTALADVTANFGGAPLAFAFIITLGSSGVVTLLLRSVGIHLYPSFRIYSIAGLIISYTYFQLPLAILLIIPSLLGLQKEWREAATSLGAAPRQYWTRVALPILMPSLLSSFFLLFANAFGAYATAWTLTGSGVNLVTVQIAAAIRGEVQLDPALADALAMLSLGIMVISVVAYRVLAKRSGIRI
jgi:putative spermidine/putrescine transport system permease protein